MVPDLTSHVCHTGGCGALLLICRAEHAGLELTSACFVAGAAKILCIYTRMLWIQGFASGWPRAG